MTTDGTSEVAGGFWVTHAGCDRRHSDGSIGEEPMLATMLHEFGWIDVAVESRRAVVRVNPAVVSEAALGHLGPALGAHAPDRRIELVLVDRDASPVDLPFLQVGDALRHLENLTIYRPEDGQESAWGSEAFPMAPPVQLHEIMKYRLVSPLTGKFADDAALDPERLARHLTNAEWLAPLSTEGALDQRRMVNCQPEMVTYGLRTMGWIAVKRNWNLHRRPMSTTAPDVVALDPGAVSREALSQLIALCGAWERFAKEFTFVWWSGAAWFRFFGLPGQVADLVRTLCRIAVNDDPHTTVNTIELPIDRLQGVQSGWSDTHPFAMALRRWRDEQAGGGSGEAVLHDLEQLGLFKERTKLLILDENNDLRISRYEPGEVRLWDDRTHRSMVGSRLIDVPDRALGMSVQRDLLTVHRRGEPVLHHCHGVLSGSSGLQLISWSRFTLPLYSGDGERRRIHGLLSTCILEQSAMV